jgi:hypothetical protein
MKPISREELLKAPVVAAADREQERVRKQQISGQLWAEGVYKDVRTVSQEGLTEFERGVPSDLSDIARDYAVKLLKGWFPDSDHRLVVYGALKGSQHYAVRISWAEAFIPIRSELEDRRFEKETNW